MNEEEPMIISTYTDEQAVEDGVLVDIGANVRFQGLPVNRMTRHLFDDLKPFVEAEAPLFDGTKCQLAQGSPDNTGEVGDIWRIPPNLWLVRNEVGGWTAMHPDDY